MAGFSKESLQRIGQELQAVPARNLHFRMNLSTDELSASFGWGEGIDICWRSDRYICIHHLERSTQTREIPNEAEAVEQFIRFACWGKGLEQ